MLLNIGKYHIKFDKPMYRSLHYLLNGFRCGICDRKLLTKNMIILVIIEVKSATQNRNKRGC